MEADHHQRLGLKFTLKEDISKEIVTAHQTFVRLTNVKTKQEVIFVAEEEPTGSTYKFDLVRSIFCDIDCELSACLCIDKNI